MDSHLLKTDYLTYTNPKNGKFEYGISGYNLYEDAASSTPVDGIGGSPTGISLVSSSDNPLTGMYSGVFTKTAINNMGKGFSFDIKIDRGNVDLTHKLIFTYETDTNYVNGDMGIYVYDIDNSILLPTSEVNISKSYGPSKFISTLLLNGSLNYRIIFHVQTVSALLYTLKLTDIQFTQKEVVIGGAIGPTIQYPLTIGATTTAPTKGTIAEDIATWARHGDKMLWSYRYRQTSAGTAGNGTYLFPLPTGHEIDLAKTPAGTAVGECRMEGTSTEGSLPSGLGTVCVYDSTHLFVRKINPVVTTEITDTIANGAFALSSANIIYGMTAVFTISNWSSNVNLNGAMDDEYLFNTQSAIHTDDTTSFGYGKGGTAILANATSVAVFYDVKPKNKIQITDKIELEVRSKIDGSWCNVDEVYVPSLFCQLKHMWLRNTYPSQTGYWTGMSYAKVTSDRVRVFFFPFSSGADGSGSSNTVWRAWADIVNAADGFDRWRIRVSKGASSSEIPPVVAASMGLTTAISVTANTAIPYATLLEDTHNCLTLGTGAKFTCKVRGRYLVNGPCYGSTVSAHLRLYKNGVVVNRVGYWLTNSAETMFHHVITLEVGDYIDLRPSTTNNMTGYSADNGYANMVQITRIGS